MKIGDEITFAWRGGDGCVRVMRARVCDPEYGDGAYYVEFELADGARPITLAQLDGNESVTWIRGHHADDSVAARALLATFALRALAP